MRWWIAIAWVSMAHAQTPVVYPGGVVNAASYAAGGVAPGLIVAIFGTNLASQTAAASSTPLPTALGNVNSVTFNGMAAPLFFVSAGQINAQVPAGLATGAANLVVTTSNGSSANAPQNGGFFTFLMQSRVMP